MSNPDFKAQAELFGRPDNRFIRRDILAALVKFVMENDGQLEDGQLKNVAGW
jgi:hypothetical protein